MLRSMCLCAPCHTCQQFGFLCFFASLHARLHVHALVYLSFVFQSNGTTNTRSKPTFVLLVHPFLLDNMFVCLFVCFTCLFALVWHLLLACLLACFLLFVSLLFFWPVYFVFASTRIEHGHL